MSILQEIHKWSQKLPEWQQDAIARLYADRQLAQGEIEHIYGLLKATHGIADPKMAIPIKLAPEQIAAPAVADRLVHGLDLRAPAGVRGAGAGHQRKESWGPR